MWILLFVLVVVNGESRFSRRVGITADVDFTDWSNFWKGSGGGCVSCPYSCRKPSLDPKTGLALVGEEEDVGAAQKNLPEIYKQHQQNGCCFAKGSKTQPNCQREASPRAKEDCGFVYGPTLTWSINVLSLPLPKEEEEENQQQKKPIQSFLLASIDCVHFWAVGKADVKQDVKQPANLKVLTGKKPIQGGCYGNPEGSAMVLLNCLTTTLKFDKSRTYTWDVLADKCIGYGGKCTRTNSYYGQNLKCCSGHLNGLNAPWNANWEKYDKKTNSGFRLSGVMITGIVIGGVCLLMLLVHCGAKVRERAKHTALMREKEATDDYEEVTTPLTSDEFPHNSVYQKTPAQVDYSFLENEGDQLFTRQRKNKEQEFLYEGQLY